VTAYASALFEIGQRVSLVASNASPIRARAAETAFVGASLLADGSKA
jgi:hypothetical protein